MTELEGDIWFEPVETFIERKTHVSFHSVSSS